MSIKAIFTDLDGTLLNPQHQISDCTASVLKKLKAKGIYFSVATGRTYVEVMDTIRKCGLEPDFIITSNGARIHDGSFNLVREHNIPAELAAQLIRVQDLPPPAHTNASPADTRAEKRYVTNVYRHGDWLTDKDVPEISGDMHKNLPCTVLGDALYAMSPEELEGVHQVWYYGAREDLEVLNAQLTSAFESQLYWTFSDKNMIDCGPLGVSKGVAVREVAEMLGVALEDVACFGDAPNDESMLQIAGKAYIMANGQPELKAAVPRGEGIGSNVEDGVAKKLEELFFAS